MHQTMRTTSTLYQNNDTIQTNYICSTYCHMHTKLKPLYDAIESVTQLSVLVMYPFKQTRHYHMHVKEGIIDTDSCSS